MQVCTCHSARADRHLGDVVVEVQQERKTSAERMAETRVRLLDAVIETLAECGYAGTSTTEIARRSGLTRGAQLHHFGTKDQMMLAAIEHLNRRTNADAFVAALDQLPSDQDRLRTALMLLAETSSGVLPAAYTEFWVASRTNPEFTEALRATDVVARETARALFGAEILSRAGPEFDARLDIVLYALRGMAVDAHLATDEERQARKDLIIGLAADLERTLQVKD